MNNMTLFPQPTNKTPENLEDVQNMLTYVRSQLIAIGEEASMLHQELSLLADAVDKEVDEERESLAITEKVSPTYKLGKTDLDYIKRFGSSWFNSSVFTALTGKSDGAMTGFIHRVRHAEDSQWIVNTKQAGGRRKIYQILPKETALHDAA